MVTLATKNNGSLWGSIRKPGELDRESYLRLIRRIRVFVIVGFIASLIAFIVIAYLSGFGRVLHDIESSNLALYAMAFVSAIISLLLGFGKWTYYMKKLKLSVPLRKNFAVYMSLYSMELTPGRIGRLVVAYTLNRITKIRFVKIMPIITVDIFTDFLGMAILALMAAIYFHMDTLLIAVLDIVILLPFLFLLNDWLFNLFKKILSKSKFLEKFSLYGEEYFMSQHKLNTMKVYTVSLVFALPSALFMSLALYFTLLSLGVVNVGPVASTFVFSSSTVIGMVTGIPGNIGITDGAMVTFISTVLGQSVPIAAAATVMSRVATLWFIIIIGTGFLFYTLSYWDHGEKGKSRKRPRDRSA